MDAEANHSKEIWCFKKDFKCIPPNMTRIANMKRLLPLFFWYKNYLTLNLFDLELVQWSLAFNLDLV